MVDSNKIDNIWKKARVVDGYDPDIIRKDACGAWIVRDKFCIMDNPFGWVIDHIYPKSRGGDDNPINLRPLHIANNISKGNSYPTYIAAKTSVGDRNVQRPSVLTVNANLQQILKDLYSHGK